MSVSKNNNVLLNQLVKDAPAVFNLLKSGDLIQGAVLGKSPKMITVDLGKYGLGAIYKSEIQNARDLIKDLKIGDQIHAKVVEVDNEEGFTELSLSEAGRQKAWVEVQELSEKEEIVVVRPTGFNRGGLVVNISGLQAFLPISQLANDHYPKVSSPDDKSQITAALEQLVGQELRVRVIDINPRTNKLIISEKAATEIDSKELAKNYEVGQIIEGIISGVADFGAFLKFTDNPAVEGLIHNSELDWRIVENPKEVVNVDDVVRAKIIDIKDGKISLSLKALTIDPWQEIGDKYYAGQEIQGKVYSFNPFGAVINLDNQIQGHLHVTEFGSVEKMKQDLESGKTYQFVVESIKAEEKRIILRLKN